MGPSVSPDRNPPDEADAVPALPSPGADEAAKATSSATVVATKGRRARVVRVDREKLALTIPVTRARELRHRCQEADVSFGEYLCGLLDECPPVPLPANYSQMVATLMSSTSQLAALSVDLNAFMRLLDKAEAAVTYRDSLRGLISDVRSHLVVASALLAELHRTRRPQC